MKMVSVLLTSLILLSSSIGQPCTALSYTSTNEVYVAKNLDWYFGHGLIFTNKRHVAKTALVLGSKPGPSWVSRYASLTVSQTGLEFPWEGINEAGLSVNILQLVPSEAPPDTDPRPAIESVQFVQYLLDTSATVAEAIQNAQRVRLASPVILHYFLCDATGACAVLESLKGQLVVHTGAQLPVKALANNRYGDSVPYYEKLRASADPGAILAHPSNDSLDRFARAAVWSTGAIDAANPTGFGFRALANLAEVFPKWRTFWSMVFSLRSRTLSVSTLTAPAVKSIRLADIATSCRSGNETLDVNAPVSGNARSAFVPLTTAMNRQLVERDPRLSAQLKAAVAAYPSQFTRCLE